MLTVGDRFPRFSLQAAVSLEPGKEFERITEESHPGRWKVVFFWPHPALRDLPFPMLADTRRELSSALGVLHKEEGVALRATFLVDPGGIIRHVSVNDLSVGRNVDETLRLLDGFRTGELVPCNWKQGEPTLAIA